MTMETLIYDANGWSQPVLRLDYTMGRYRDPATVKLKAWAETKPTHKTKKHPHPIEDACDNRYCQITRYAHMLEERHGYEWLPAIQAAELAYDGKVTTARDQLNTRSHWNIWLTICTLPMLLIIGAAILIWGNTPIWNLFTP